MRALSRPAFAPIAAILTAVLAGPMIGALTLSAFALVVLITSGDADFQSFASWYNAATFFVLLIAVTYYSGWPIALLAGVIVAIWSIKRTVRLWVVVGAAGVASLCIEVLANAQDIWSGSWDLFKANLPIDFGLAVWAGFWCWLIIARPLVRALNKRQQSDVGATDSKLS